MYSLFDSFFAPPTIVVVSEERLQAAEREQRRNQLEALDKKIDELTEYRTRLSEDFKKLYPAQEDTVNEQ